jgi:septum site-determining protein MinC
MALVFAPELPLTDWFTELDEWCKRSPGYFVGRPIILDVSGLDLDKAGLAKLIADLAEREIRIMGVEGTKASWLGLGMPPLVSGSRATAADIPEITIAAKPPAKASAQSTRPAATARSSAAANPPAAAEAPVVAAPELPRRPAALVHDNPVRSGQSVIFPQGDVTIIGSVASGSEVVAGGSIHIYGSLRGRAIAGCSGGAASRIFCNRLEAELIAIDGLYRTADEMDPELRGRPVQAWLDGETMSMAALS